MAASCHWKFNAGAWRGGDGPAHGAHAVVSAVLPACALALALVAALHALQRGFLRFALLRDELEPEEALVAHTNLSGQGS